MSDGLIDELAESARNRGLKLVRSRIRTPTKRGFGKVGLTDPAGAPVFGMDAKGPSARPEDVELYLRNLGAQDWGASLDVAVRPRKKPKKPARAAANDAEPGSRPERQASAPLPKTEPKPALRDARPGDAEALVELVALLDHQTDAPSMRKRIAHLVRDKLPPIVATLDTKVVGVCGIDAMVTIHRERPVGRINILVVSKQARTRGIGRMLVEAAEAYLKTLGCGMVEVTSNDRLAAAHAFYRHMGYERTSIRFVKTL